jgi:hypothetical protein
MNDNWMTIEQAAVTLGLSVRTVNRHITAGKLESRLNDGRREVSIDLPQGRAAAAAGAASTGSSFAGGGSTDLAAPDYETVLALADNAADKADMAVSAFQTLARSADERIGSTRRAAAVAWSLVGVMTIGALVSVGWTSHKLTRAAVETRHLHEQVSSVTAIATSTDEECNDLRRALAAAREEAARAEGQLAAHAERRLAEPTTAPTLVDRIASIFVEE